MSRNEIDMLQKKGNKTTNADHNQLDDPLPFISDTQVYNGKGSSNWLWSTYRSSPLFLTSQPNMLIAFNICYIRDVSRNSCQGGGRIYWSSLWFNTYFI